MSEDSSTVVSVGKVVYTLQLLPEKAGVRVTSCYHPLYYDECQAAGIPSGTFVLKDSKANRSELPAPASRARH